MGVKFVTNFIVGMTESIEDLKKEGFKGFYVASGAGLPNFMNIPGENANGVLSSNEYLTRVNLMGADNEFSDTPVYRGKNVVVVGGGNTAMDSVRTAKRLGAERAMIVYRRSEEEMPARLEEVKHAKEEGCYHAVESAGVLCRWGYCPGRSYGDPRYGRRTPGSCSYGCSAKIVIGLYREGAGPKVLAFVVSSYLFFTSFLIRVKKRLQR